MKALLAAMCIFVIVVTVFFGGCTLLLFGSGNGSLGFLPILLITPVVLNGLVLYGLFGAAKPFKPAFYILGGIDFLIAIGSLFSMTTILTGYSNDATTVGLTTAFLAIVALKGALTIYFARSL